jgi:endo-1,4-beta-xylanase
MTQENRIALCAGLFATLLLVAAPVKASGAEAGLNRSTAGEGETLRQYADRIGFVLGALLSEGGDWARDLPLQEVLGREFNSAVSVAFMSFAEPERGQYKLRFMDESKEIARKYHLKLFGQALVYRASDTTPKWLHLNTADCGGWSSGDLGQILRDYIHTVVRYGGDSYSTWEVVNEPITPFHNGCWSKVLGEEEYIAKAFRYAREATPGGTLLLNDTFGAAGVDKSKTDQFFGLVKRLKSKGVPIDAVGSEMHLDADKLHSNYIEELKYWLRQAQEAGVKAQITEMDVYQGEAGTVAAPLENQKQVFHNVLRTCLGDSSCSGFTTWAITDRYTWRRQEQFKNSYHSDASPCLFDENFVKKPAYYGVLQALREGR